MKVNQQVLAGLSGVERLEAEAALEEIAARLVANPLEGYFPHSRQSIFHGFDAKVKVFLGGNQSGKTTGGLVDDLIQALPLEALPEHLRPYKTHTGPFKCRIMTRSFGVLETVLYEKLRELVPMRELSGGSWETAYNRDTKVLNFACGSRFFFATFEQDPNSQGGWTGDRVHYDEEPPIAHRQEGRLRVMRYDGDEVFTMTPTEGLSWCYDELWERRGEETERGVFIKDEMQIVLVDMDDNPALSESAKRAALEGFSAEELAARKSGRFVAMHGLIFSEFSHERHVMPELDELPANVNVVIGIDPGMRHRCAVLWAYVDPADRMVVFDEGYYQGHTVSDVCREIHVTNTRWSCTPIYYVIDPAARNMNHQTGRSDQMEYADNGVVAISGQNAVRPGINRVKERFEREEGIAITANCRSLLSELRKYRWKKPPRTGEDGKEEPVKRDDHAVDCLRYIAMSRPYLPTAAEQTPETQIERAMREDMERRSSRSGGQGFVGHAV